MTKVPLAPGGTQVLPEFVPAPKWPYLLLAIGGTMVTLATIVVVLILRPEQDNSQLIATIVAVTAPTIAAVLALIKGTENAAALNEMRIVVNGRLAELLARTAQAERLLGRDEGEVKAAVQATTLTELAERTAHAAVKAADVAAKVAEIAAITPPIGPPGPEGGT
jgi:uncharacterized membrane protein YccC